MTTLTTLSQSATYQAVSFATVCPTAPPGAQVPVDQIMGYVLWAVVALFVVGIVVAIAAVVAGRVFAMPHASRPGVVGIVIVFIAVILYLILPGIVTSMVGAGCVSW